MSTIRETLETAFAATAFAEHGLKKEAQFLMQGQRPQATATAATHVEKRPRPTLQAK